MLFRAKYWTKYITVLPCVPSSTQACPLRSPVPPLQVPPSSTCGHAYPHAVYYRSFICDDYFDVQHLTKVRINGCCMYVVA